MTIYFLFDYKKIDGSWMFLGTCSEESMVPADTVDKRIRLPRTFFFGPEVMARVYDGGKAQLVWVSEDSIKEGIKKVRPSKF